MLYDAIHEVSKAARLTETTTIPWSLSGWKVELVVNDCGVLVFQDKKDFKTC
jgi:hypothetical protein